MRHSIKVQEVIECAKVELLDLSAAEIEAGGDQVNISRLSAMTGLHRRDVMRIYKKGEVKDYSYNLVNKVVGQWRQDPRFLTKARKPKVLTYDGEDSDFRLLMKSVATDLKPGTVLFELERVGVIEYTQRGIKLIVETYEPSVNPEDGFEILSDDLNDIVTAVDENVFTYEEPPHLHAKTVYDNVCPDELSKIRTWILKEGAAFHRRARKFLSQFDLDVFPDPKKKGGMRIAVGTFSRFSGEDLPTEDI